MSAHHQPCHFPCAYCQNPVSTSHVLWALPVEIDGDTEHGTIYLHPYCAIDWAGRLNADGIEAVRLMKSKSGPRVALGALKKAAAQRPQ